MTNQAVHGSRRLISSCPRRTEVRADGGRARSRRLDLPDSPHGNVINIGHSHSPAITRSAVLLILSGKLRASTPPSLSDVVAALGITRGRRQSALKSTAQLPLRNESICLTFSPQNVVASIMSLTARLSEWSNPMPVLLWLLGVPIVVILALYVFHIL